MQLSKIKNEASEELYSTGDDRAARLEHLPRIRFRQPIQWVLATLVLVAAGLLIYSIALNPNMRWDAVGEFLLNLQVLQGVVWTIVLSIAAMVISIVLGVVIAVMRLSSNNLLKYAAGAYLWFFRGVPLLVQLILWFNLALLFPQLGLPMFFGEGAPGGVDTNSVINWFVAALIGFGLHEAAYMSEIVRSGFLSVDRGQNEAAAALGMTSQKTLNRILLPQALRIIVPPTVNQFVNLLKATALVAFIAGQDLLSAVQTIYAQNYLIIPLLMVATIWYLVLVTIATIAQHYVEKRLGRGYGASSSKRSKRVSTVRKSTSGVWDTTRIRGRR